MFQEVGTAHHETLKNEQKIRVRPNRIDAVEWDIRKNICFKEHTPDMIKKRSSQKNDFLSNDENKWLLFKTEKKHFFL